MRGDRPVEEGVVVNGIEVVCHGTCCPGGNGGTAHGAEPLASPAGVLEGIKVKTSDRAVRGPFLFACLPTCMGDPLVGAKPVELLIPEVCQGGRVGDALEVGLLP